MVCSRYARGTGCGDRASRENRQPGDILQRAGREARTGSDEEKVRTKANRGEKE
jgi:hypothetical protein